MPAEPPPLPADVLLALRQGRREAAVELLQLRLGVGAREAGERIDRYLEDNPPLSLRGPGVVAANKINALIWLSLIVLMGLVYLLLAD
ncbi:hypothetical protein HP532_02555 [Pseudomonas sp. CrR25]|nr:hypothetical protein [Pseudomonas sp. CrR25]